MSLSSYRNVTYPMGASPIFLPHLTELVRGEESHFVEQLLPEVRRASVALDLSNVERIDAAGIAALITLYCTAVESGTTFSVVKPANHVLELLRIVGLESILVAGANRVSAPAPLEAEPCLTAA
jgi:anti-anti-sigma factor